MGTIVTWIASKIGLSTLVVQIILYCAGGLAIFLAFQKYTNYINDKAVTATTIKISKQLAAEEEKRVSLIRAQIEKRQQELDIEQERLTSERFVFEKEMAAFNSSLGEAIKKAEKTKEVRYVQIQGEVENIPGDSRCYHPLV
jgi:hypothetical protein